MRIDDESVREFFRVAATVDLTAHERDVLHLFWSNDDAARFASKDLKRMHSTVRDVHLDPKRKLSYDTRLAFGSRFVWDLVLVPGATYVYSGGESIVSVANTQLRNKDVLICVRVADGSGDPVFKVKSGLQFVLRQVEFRAEYPASSGNFVAVKAYPIKYNMYAPVFSKQGSEADYVHVHCEKLRGAHTRGAAGHGPDAGRSDGRDRRTLQRKEVILRVVDDGGGEARPRSRWLKHPRACSRWTCSTRAMSLLG